MPAKPPYVVTAGLPDDIASWAERLRRTHFPVERNKLHAHVTLFHSFAPSLFDELKRALPRFAAEYSPPDAAINGILKWEKGTAIAIDSPAMSAIRGHIADHFHGSLTAQDLIEPRLHITIQNKVSVREAAALQAELATQITARAFRFPALEMHIYRETHWGFVGRWGFRGKESG